MVHVSDGKSRPEPLRLNLTMELLSLQKLEVVTPTSHPNGPPMESKVSFDFRVKSKRINIYYPLGAHGANNATKTRRSWA